MKLSLFCFSICCIIVLSACQRAGKPANDRPYILATTGMIADMLKNIVKDSAYVVALMNPGIDPHLYKANQGDLRKILDSDYIFYNGLHLEGKLSGILEKQRRLKPVIGLGEELQSGLIGLGDNTYDPHIWFDVSLWKEVTAIAAHKLAQLDIGNAEFYRVNATAFLTELDSLDRWVRAKLQAIPVEKRVLITAHDAFSYFGEAYGMEVRGLQGISTLSEFGLRDVSDLVNYISAHQIPAVFVESSVSDKALQAVVAGVKQRGGQLSIGGSLYSDAMGKAGSIEGTYIGMVRHNVNTIVEALGYRK